MKSLRKKRILALIVDYIIITVLINVISTLSFINPNHKEYLEYSEKYMDAYTEYVKNPEKSSLETITDYSYYVIKYGVVYDVVKIAIIIAYLGVYQYQKGGQTLGKKWQHIKLESSSGKLTLGKTIIRSVILYNLIFVALTCISVYTFSSKNFLIANGVISLLSNIMVILILLTVLIRKDGLGLHDKICKTKVVEI